MYSYSRLSSKFDGRNILVDVLQECCGTAAEQAQKRKEFADVSQNPKKSLTGLKIGRDTRTLLENRRKGLYLPTHPTPPDPPFFRSHPPGGS